MGKQFMRDVIGGKITIGPHPGNQKSIMGRKMNVVLSEVKNPFLPCAANHSPAAHRTRTQQLTLKHAASNTVTAHNREELTVSAIDTLSHY